MIPLKDANRSETFPFMTVILIIVNVLVFLHEANLGSQVNAFFDSYGVVPERIVNFDRLQGGFTGNVAVPMIASLFIHGGLLHIVGNMWFLWVFGDNVEDRLGHVRFLLFYLLCGVGASLIHVFFYPDSALPTIGASGAISGVLGAYLILFPHARIYTLLFIVIIIRFVELPAYIFLIIWFGFQILSGAADLRATHDATGVAYWAHIGGFVVGVILLFLFPKRSAARTIS
jgi:membrane associated rhomboid family serine protease